MPAGQPAWQGATRGASQSKTWQLMPSAWKTHSSRKRFRELKSGQQASEPRDLSLAAIRSNWRRNPTWPRRRLIWVTRRRAFRVRWKLTSFSRRFQAASSMRARRTRSTTQPSAPTTHTVQKAGFTPALDSSSGARVRVVSRGKTNPPRPRSTARAFNSRLRPYPARLVSTVHSLPPADASIRRGWLGPPPAVNRRVPPQPSVPSLRNFSAPSRITWAIWYQTCNSRCSTASLGRGPAGWLRSRFRSTLIPPGRSRRAASSRAAATPPRRLSR